MKIAIIGIINMFDARVSLWADTILKTRISKLYIVTNKQYIYDQLSTLTFNNNLVEVIYNKLGIYEICNNIYQKNKSTYTWWGLLTNTEYFYNLNLPEFFKKSKLSQHNVIMYPNIYMDDNNLITDITNYQTAFTKISKKSIYNTPSNYFFKNDIINIKITQSGIYGNNVSYILSNGKQPENTTMINYSRGGAISLRVITILYKVCAINYYTGTISNYVQTCLSNNNLTIDTISTFFEYNDYDIKKEEYFKNIFQSYYNKPINEVINENPYNTAILYICHIINEESVKRYNYIKNSIKLISNLTLYWAYDNSQEQQDVNSLKNNNNDINIWYFNFTELNNKYGIYNKEMQSRFPNCDYISIQFNEEHPEYEYIWSIEYDCIMINNSWHKFFNTYINNQADLITGNTTFLNTALNMNPAIPTHYIEFPEDYAKLQSFNPCMRLSAALLNKLREYYSKYNGFFEITDITVCYNNKLIIEDYGGQNLFTPQNMYNKFYYSENAKFNTGLYSCRKYNQNIYDRYKNMYNGMLLHAVKLDVSV